MCISSADKRTQKQPVQLPPPKTHGGRRPGAGRPNRSGTQAHLKRPRLSGHLPLHVTLRLRAGLPSLRRKDVYRELRHAAGTAKKKGFGVVHFAILSNHLHFILEASSERVLGRQMQSFSIALAKRINRLAGRKGPAFSGRYFARVLVTPVEVRRAVAYVLGNEGKHKGESKTVYVGPFSSVAVLPKAEEVTRLRAIFGRALTLVAADSRIPSKDGLAAEIVREPRTWLLKIGWRRARAD